MKNIVLSGVKQNNLKNINVEIPLGSFTVICGPSGSGKSSLAFETLYAEGQRRYIESLSTYARQFLNRAPKPNVDFVENIPPALAIEQKNYVKNSRSTVGTTTEIVDYLRLLYEKIGTPMCPNGHGPIKREFVNDGVYKIMHELPDARIYLLVPVYKDRKILKGPKLLPLLLKEGLQRIFSIADKEVIEINSKSKLPESDFYVVVDRLQVNGESRSRIVDSLSQAYLLSRKFNQGLMGGHAFVFSTDGRQFRLCEDNSCSTCGTTLPEINSRLFSFSSPYGACEKCKGFGNILEVDEQKVIPNPKMSLAQGCLEPLQMPSNKRFQKKIMDYARKAKIPLDTSWENLTKDQRKKIWQGDGDFDGVKGFFDYLEEKKYKMHVRFILARYKSPFECKECGGSRLRKEALYIKIQEKSIAEMCEMPLGEFQDFLKNLKLSNQQRLVADEIFRQVLARVSFLVEVGVDYLSLDRLTKTLSGGEYQRIMLAKQLGMELSQTLYVLDEPTVGLHPRDNARLISILKRLNDLGNTLVIVEHDREVIESSQYVLEMGPGSGHLGGEILFRGPFKTFLGDKKSLTAGYLVNKNSKVLKTHRPTSIEQFKYKIEIKGCQGHNLKDIDVIFPLNRLVCVTGVSGSGKSTLVCDTLYPAIARALNKEFEKAEPFDKILGVEYIKNVMLIDQRPIGRSSRSNAVTYMKLYDDIRSILASTQEAHARGYTPGHFSFNVDGGRCPVCKGDGYEIIDMVFMEEMTLKCEACDGKRFTKEVLEIKYRDKNIDDILNLTVAEAMDFFVNYPNIRKPLSLLREVGLDYIRLGQPATTLSGGESQRLKIAKEFEMSQQRQTLYILDEPTTGLHFREVEMLLSVIDRLIESGASVIVIEHNMEVIKNADYIIDLGPEGGHKGGTVVATGTPDQIKKSKKSYTAEYLT